MKFACNKNSFLGCLNQKQKKEQILKDNRTMFADRNVVFAFVVLNEEFDQTKIDLIVSRKKNKCCYAVMSLVEFEKLMFEK